MQLYPTRAAVDLAAVAIAVVAVGVLTRAPAIVAWGGALLIGLAIARGVTLLGVSRVRAAGFEMLWREETRRKRIARGETVELRAEVRNRDTLAARYVELRAVHAPELRVAITPSSGEVPANGRLRVTVKVTAQRVGRYGLHGLSLEVRGSPGLFEIPLTFPNPFGIEVWPAPYGTNLRTARGGRSRSIADAGRPGPVSGDGVELREIRELVPGDSFKRIAWKASARRGKLLVRDYEREERDVVWLIVDASVELLAGPFGLAPLDFAIDQAAAVAQAHHERGDRVGVAVCGARLLALVRPGRGPAHTASLFAALSTATNVLDEDRSDLDEADAASRVLEHLRPHDPQAAAGVRASDVDRVARRAEAALARAPFPPADVYSTRYADHTLRRYLSSFGISGPPRLEPDRPKSDIVLARTLDTICREKSRPSLVFLWSPTLTQKSRPFLFDALVNRPRRGIELRWVPMTYEPSIVRTGPIGNAVGEALSLRMRAAETHGERALRKLGVRVEPIHPRPSRAGAPVAAAEGAPATAVEGAP